MTMYTQRASIIQRRPGTNRFSLLLSACTALAFYLGNAQLGRAMTFQSITAFEATTTSLTTEDFESAPWSPFSPQPMPTVNLGVSWTAQDQLRVFNERARSGRFCITDFDGNTRRDQLFATLPGGITAVGGWVYGFDDGRTYELLAFDASNVLLESMTLADPGDYFTFMGITTSQPIHRIEWRKPVPDAPFDDFLLDDFVFGVDVVPEPASLALAIGAVVGLAARRRRGASV